MATNVSELSMTSSQAAAPPRSRISAFDFMKGALVFVMVGYHWLNYFSDNQSLYKYLRFLTPSFIFITGFLISSVYLPRYDRRSWQIPARLLQRGLKLFLLFIGLNLTLWSLSAVNGGPALLASRISLNSLLDLAISGSTHSADGKVASFYILLPISYLLLVSSGVLSLLRFQRHAIEWASAIAMLGALALYQFGTENANLEMLAIGLLGVAIGCIPLATITGVVMRPLLIVPAYLLYTVAIAVWDTLYPLQIVGVLLNLTILYFLADRSDDSSRVSRCLLLLGKYSLFGYLVQLAILQVLARAFRLIPESSVALGLTFISAPVLTVLAVVVLDRMRSRAPFVNTVYTAVFA
ncbi:MAG: hypothetical protein ABIR70_14490 [Bryobacteraceae bacterium]